MASDSVGQIGLDLVVNDKGFKKQMTGMQNMAKKAGIALAAAFSVKKIADFAASCLELGSDLQEVQNVVDVSFPQMSKQVDAFAQNAAASFGLSETMAKRFTGTFGAMSKAFGFSEKQAYEMSTTLTGLAGDVDSANSSAKKLKKTLSTLAVDSLNILNSNSDDSDTSGSASGSGIDFNVDETTGSTTELSNATSDLQKRLEELANTFKDGFQQGLGSDFENSLKRIKGHVDNIGSSLKDIFTDKSVVSSASEMTSKITKALGQTAGSTVSIGTSLAENLIGGVDNYLSQNKDYIKERLVGIFDATGEIAEIVGELNVSIAGIFEVFRGDTAKQCTADLIGIVANAGLGMSQLALQIGEDIINCIAKPITDNEDKIKLAIENTLNPISTILSTLNTSVQDTFNKIFEVYDSKIKPAFDGIAEGLSSIFSTVLDAYNEHIAPVLETLSTKFNEVWSSSIQPTINKAIEFIGKLADFISTLWTTVVAPFINWLINTLVPVLAPIIETIGKTFMNVFGAISKIIGGVIDILGGLLDFVTGLFKGDWEQCWEGVKSIFEGFCGIVSGLVSGLWSFIAGIFSAAIEVVVGIVVTIWNTVTGIFTTAVNAISSIVSTMWDMIAGVISNAGENIEFFVTTIWNSIKSTTSSIFEGIKDVISTVWDSIKTIISTVINNITDALMVGHGAGITYSGTDLSMGSYNSAESGKQENGSYKFVWDFNANQANGEIASVCLTTKAGGFAGWGSDTDVEMSSDMCASNRMTEKIDFNVLANNDTAVVRYINLEEEYAVALSETSWKSIRTNKVLKFYKIGLRAKTVSPFDKISIYGTYCGYGYTNIEEKTITLTDYLDEIGYYYTSALTDEYLYFLFSSTNTLASGASTKILRVNQETYECMVINVENTTEKTLAVGAMAVSGNYLFMTTTDNCICAINLYDSADACVIKKVDGNEFVNDSSLYIWGNYEDRIAITLRNISYDYAQTYFVTTEDFIIRKTSMKANTLTINSSNASSSNGGMISVKNSNKILKAYRNSTQIYLYYPADVLMTINNLDAPVSKTSAQSMRVTYILSPEQS